MEEHQPRRSIFVFSGYPIHVRENTLLSDSVTCHRACKQILVKDPSRLANTVELSSSCYHSVVFGNTIAFLMKEKAANYAFSDSGDPPLLYRLKRNRAIRKQEIARSNCRNPSCLIENSTGKPGVLAPAASSKRSFVDLFEFSSEPLFVAL